MIYINNEKKFNLTLKTIKKNELKNELIIKKDFATTLIAEDKTIYLYLEKTNYSKVEVLEKLFKFAQTNEYDLNINVEEINACLGTETCYCRIISEVFFSSAQKNYSLKTVYAVKNKREINYNLIFNNCKSYKKIVNEIQITTEFTEFAKYLQNAPPNLMNSVVMAEEIAKKAQSVPSIKVTILNKKQIQDLNMNLLLSVNAASAIEPRVIILEYYGNPNTNEKIGLVGKGITFDTGGLSIKPSPFMKGMKFDMSGAAIVCSSLMAIAKAQLPVNITAVGCLTDNTVGSTATIPESIITSMNSKTVQIDNTDAEGRLVLADGITYSIRKLKVDKIIEMSTLTGACLISLGEEYTGVFTNCQEWADYLLKSAKETGELVWQLPVGESHKKYIRSSVFADISNIGPTRYGGASTAAAFLLEFAENKPFIHCDIAGSATSKDATGTGVLVKTLFNLFKTIYN